MATQLHKILARWVARAAQLQLLNLPVAPVTRRALGLMWVLWATAAAVVAMAAAVAAAINNREK